MLQEFLPEALALFRLCMTLGKFPLLPTGRGASELMLCHFCLSPHLIFSSVPVRCHCSPPRLPELCSVASPAQRGKEDLGTAWSPHPGEEQVVLAWSIPPQNAEGMRPPLGGVLI